MEHVPSPADFPPRPTAEELLDSIAAEGGRVFRYMEPPRVFVLTQSADLTRRLERLGGRVFYPPHAPAPSPDAPMGAYKRTREGPWEWDIEIGAISVEGDWPLWQTASAYRNGVKE